MSKKLYHGDEARMILKKGIDEVANAVRVTLGANGRNVVIGRNTVSPHITKDGVTVAKSIELSDYFENIGVNLAKEVATKTVTLAGDGTTTSVILTQSLVNLGMTAIKMGLNPIELKLGMERATEYVVEELKRLSFEMRSTAEITGVATVSCNNDPILGQTIADVFSEIGRNGVIKVESNDSPEIAVSYAKGFRIPKGYLSNAFDNKVVLTNPLILLIEGRITNVEDIMKILEYANRNARQLLIICENADETTMTTLVRNYHNGSLKVCIVRPVGAGDNMKEAIKDIQSYVGGRIFGPNHGSLATITGSKDLGNAASVIIGEHVTDIIGGTGVGVVERIHELTGRMEEETNPILKSILKDRISNLATNVAIIRVGGFTETETNEKKDRVDDAIQAVRAAFEEGYSYGGGTAYIFAAQSLEQYLAKLEGSLSYKEGFAIVGEALFSVIDRLLTNAGMEHELIMQVLDKGYEWGVNVKTRELSNLKDQGILDSSKVLRVALESAVSIASIFLTTECVIGDEFSPQAFMGR